MFYAKTGTVNFSTPLGRNVNWVLYLARVTNSPTSEPNYRLFWPCRKMNGNRSGFCVKPRQLHTTMRVVFDNPCRWVARGCLQPAGNGEQLFAVVCNGEQWLTIASGCLRLFAMAGNSLY